MTFEGRLKEVKKSGGSPCARRRCHFTGRYVIVFNDLKHDLLEPHGAADNDPVVDENRAIGCEGDCNSCPLQGLHVELRTRARAAEAVGAPMSVRLAEPVFPLASGQSVK